MDPITRQAIAVAGGAGSSDPLYVDDVFSTFLYDGTGSTQSINNGIDLSGEGGLVWIKQRDESRNHSLYDTERGVLRQLVSNANFAQGGASGNDLDAFNSNGFSLGTDTFSIVNKSGGEYASWTFRKAPGFFDVVTYTGSGSSQTISHNLGSVPGFIIVKRYSATEDWTCYHRSIGNGSMIQLNGTGGSSPATSFWNDTTPTSTHFTIGTHDRVNTNGQSYVAYIFAHDDQSFGTNSDEAIIHCGTFNGGGSYNNNIIKTNIGFEPQFVIWKRIGSSGDWYLMDVSRKMSDDGYNSAALVANGTSNEYTPTRFWAYEDGFAFDEDLGGSSASYIYIAIRRPHKPPTAGTEVFDVGLRSGSGSDANTNSDINTDMTFVLRRDTSGEYNGISARLTGRLTLRLDTSDSSLTGWLDNDKPWATQKGAIINGGNGAANTGNLIDFSFKRAPGFFDVVSWKGNNTNRAINHNLGAAPEIMIVKGRDIADGWQLYNKVSGATKYMNLNQYGAVTGSTRWNNTEPTSSVFTVGTDGGVNRNGYKYLAYLFASTDGVSKIGSYSGTGYNVNVDCGFSAGARFILIKREDGGYSTNAHWYVFNSARGIVSGNDPYMMFDETDSEVTNTDYIDPLNAGFTVTSSAPAALNASGGTYLFLAIA